MDEAKENELAEHGFNMRTGEFHVFRAKAVVCTKEISHFQTKIVGEGMGRTYAP